MSDCGPSSAKKSKPGCIELHQGKTTKTFQDSWLQIDSFKGWLEAIEGDNRRARCKACNVIINCGKSELEKHASRVKHIKNVKIVQSNRSVVDCFSKKSDEAKLAEQVKAAEIKLATFFAEHNVAFSTVDHLVPVLKDVFPDSSIASGVTLGRTKCTNIVKNVVAKVETDKTVQLLKDIKFSILVDESTDISDSKHMCVLVKYLSPIDGRVKTQLLELIPLDAKDCSAENLFIALESMLKEKDIPITNIIGMACDNASVMVGSHNSVITRLRNVVPNFIVLNCICHSSALVASKACEKLPRTCEELIRSVASYISGSAKRCAVLQEFQEFFGVERKKVLKLSSTRWLVLHACVVRLLENWDVFLHYFRLAAVEDKLKSAEMILHELENSYTKAYMLFLKYVLVHFNTFNALFQSRKILIHKLSEDSLRLFQNIGQNFLIPDVLNEMHKINKLQPCHYLPLESVYLGPECEQLLQTLPRECEVGIHQLRRKCLDFYITATEEMKKRLPIQDEFFENLKFIEPNIALTTAGRTQIKDVSCVASKFGGFEINTLAVEWRSLPLLPENRKKELSEMDLDCMWSEIAKLKDFQDQLCFQNISKLAYLVLSLPHSNAEAERIFSMVSDVKTRKRNRIGGENLNSICVVRSSFQANEIDCTTFKVEQKHLSLHNKKNLY